MVGVVLGELVGCEEGEEVGLKEDSVGFIVLSITLKVA